MTYFLFHFEVLIKYTKNLQHIFLKLIFTFWQVKVSKGICSTAEFPEIAIHIYQSSIPGRPQCKHLLQLSTILRYFSNIQYMDIPTKKRYPVTPQQICRQINISTQPHAWSELWFWATRR
jgi:hypothetical protein